MITGRTVGVQTGCAADAECGRCMRVGECGAVSVSVCVWEGCGRVVRVVSLIRHRCGWDVSASSFLSGVTALVVRSCCRRLESSSVLSTPFPELECGSVWGSALYETSDCCMRESAFSYTLTAACSDGGSAAQVVLFWTGLRTKSFPVEFIFTLRLSGLRQLRLRLHF